MDIFDKEKEIEYLKKKIEVENKLIKKFYNQIKRSS